MIKDCPTKPPMLCENCGEEGIITPSNIKMPEARTYRNISGHMKRNCGNPRKINRQYVADTTPEAAWDKLKQAVSERDMDDAKEAVQEYVKAVGGSVTYRELQESLIHQNINLWLIANERTLVSVFTNMDLQGNMGKKYTVSYRFSDKPERPREIDGWPKSQEEILARLDDAGDVVDSGIPKCRNCEEMGHTTKTCTQERVERDDKPKLSCYNCMEEGHRMRDCMVSVTSSYAHIY